MLVLPSRQRPWHQASRAGLLLCVCRRSLHRWSGAASVKRFQSSAISRPEGEVQAVPIMDRFAVQREGIAAGRDDILQSHGAGGGRVGVHRLIVEISREPK